MDLRSKIFIGCCGLLLAAGCGRVFDGAPRSPSRSSSANLDLTTQDAPIGAVAAPAALGVDTTVCLAQPAALSLAPSTFQSTIYPILSAKCARCHQGDAERQNSTTCQYLRASGHLEAVILRMENSIAADALKADPANLLDNNAIRDQVSGGDRETWPMPPLNRNNGPAITEGDIAIFRTWGDEAVDCNGAATMDDDLPAATEYSNDSEDDARLVALFGSSSCEEGAGIIDDEARWSDMLGRLAAPAGAASAFYDFQTKDYVLGATAMKVCTMDELKRLAANIQGAPEVLGALGAAGWRPLQCALVNGAPQAYVVNLAKVTDTLGQATYGAILKKISFQKN